jgi:hypothetical protein
MPLLALLLTAGLVGCGSSTGPHANGLSVVSGAGQSDTILSTLPRSVVVQLYEPGGLYGHVVQFSSVFSGSNPLNAYAYVRRLDWQFAGTFAVDTTSSEGRAEIEVVLGPIAGPARILVSVPDFGITDLITFTATPGNAVGVYVAPGDTAVTVNGTVTLRGGAVDARGNVRSDPVTYSVLSGPVTVSGATVTGTGVGRASIQLTADGKSATASFTVVPQGVLAAAAGNTVRIFNLDGSGMQTISVPLPYVTEVRWSPLGTSLAFGDDAQALFTVTPSGTVTQVDATTGYDQWPQWSRDGSTIYYSKISGNNTSALWHVTPTGANDDSVSIQNPSFDIFPSPSPDGTKLAYVADLGNTSDLRVLTLSTGAVADLQLVAWAPVWSPTGQTIAYLDQFSTTGPIAVVNADGTGQRVLNSATYGQDFDWSPDGQYIVALNGLTGQFDLITVATGVALPLPYTGGFSSPSWKATAGASPLHVPVAAPRVQARRR